MAGKLCPGGATRTAARPKLHRQPPTWTQNFVSALPSEGKNELPRHAASLSHSTRSSAKIGPTTTPGQLLRQLEGLSHLLGGSKSCEALPTVLGAHAPGCLVCLVSSLPLGPPPLTAVRVFKPTASPRLSRHTMRRFVDRSPNLFRD